MLAAIRKLIPQQNSVIGLPVNTTTAISPPVETLPISEVKHDIDPIIEKIEQNDPSVLNLRDVGDGHIWMAEGDKFEGIESQPITTLIGSKHIKPIFLHKILIVNSWDKNAVYYNLDDSAFPNLTHIFMLSHPCEYSVPWRFKNALWILPYQNKRYFDGHPGYVEMTDVQRERLYAAIKKFPSYTTSHNGGYSGHDLRLRKE